MINYNQLLEEQLQQIKNYKLTPNLLLHSCCAPCSSYVISYLTNYFNITIFYYNPNIYPIEEYEKRKQEQIKLIKKLKHTNKLNIIDCDYDNEIYKQKIKGLEKELEGGKRCYKCFELRLEKTAKIAKDNNFDYFSTTLTVSPHKNADILNEIGINFQNKYNIKWLYSNFKKKDGYKKSIELSKKYNLYRQNYCGCKYSKPE